MTKKRPLKKSFNRTVRFLAFKNLETVWVKKWLNYSIAIFAKKKSYSTSHPTFRQAQLFHDGYYPSSRGRANLKPKFQNVNIRADHNPYEFEYKFHLLHVKKTSQCGPEFRIRSDVDLIWIWIWIQSFSGQSGSGSDTSVMENFHTFYGDVQ